jgi:hypothetical protein
VRPAQQRVENYRKIAEELRTAADEMRTPTGRHNLQTLAANYDLLADRIEAQARCDRRKSRRVS